jgi:hypothetical protein
VATADGTGVTTTLRRSAMSRSRETRPWFSNRSITPVTVPVLIPLRRARSPAVIGP